MKLCVIMMDLRVWLVFSTLVLIKSWVFGSEEELKKLMSSFIIGTDFGVLLYTLMYLLIDK